MTLVRCYICHEGDPTLEAERQRKGPRRPARPLKKTHDQVTLCTTLTGEGCFERLARGGFRR